VSKKPEARSVCIRSEMDQFQKHRKGPRTWRSIKVSQRSRDREEEKELMKTEEEERWKRMHFPMHEGGIYITFVLYICTCQLLCVFPAWAAK
jgi:hypothetical protein